ncbi:MAG: tetratricopeptide repeat protein [Bacteroidales bacterium]|nr:tetratricopeptide repeat protein [Bacteroidales bacterium]
MKNIFALIIFSVLSLSSIAQPDSLYKYIEQGNKAYIENEFEKAILAYETVIQNGYSAAELYYNLGNAYYRTKNYKAAILNYERALRLAPDDENIKTNLEFAKNHIQDRIEEIPKLFIVKWFDNFINLFSSQTWSIISISSFILALLLAMLFLFSKSVSIRKTAFFFGIILMIGSAISFYNAYKQNYKINGIKEAIVFSPTVTVKSAPKTNGTDLFIIHEGLKVKIIGSTHGWKEIKLSDGKIGWLPDDSIVII